MNELKKLALPEYKISADNLAKIFNILIELPTRVSGEIVFTLIEEIKRQEIDYEKEITK